MIFDNFSHHFQHFLQQNPLQPISATACNAGMCASCMLTLILQSVIKICYSEGTSCY